ncbi:MAG TPA: hypothetical protein VF185_00735 [Patescibacteria group bacterium]
MQYDLNDLLIKPSSNEEEKYCKKYNIHIRRLENGATILGIPCKKDFTSWAQIKYEFLEGAYGNKPGSVHLLEHFINKKTKRTANENSLNIGAYTNLTEIGEEVSGIANPAALDYGVWTILDQIRKSLESPLINVDNIEKTLETERDVIKAEIQKRDSDQNFQISKHFNHVVFSKENPLHDVSLITGTEKDLNKLSSDMLKDIERRILIAKNLLISFYTEGDLSIADVIEKELENSFSDFPTDEKEGLNRRLLEKINPNLLPGSTYSQDSGIKNGIITTEFVWTLNHKFPSDKHLGLLLLYKIIATELFLYSRKMGWGYFTDTILTRPTNNLVLLRLRIDARKDNQKELLKGIKEVLLSIKKVSQSVVENEKKRQKAIPINAVARLSWIVNGIKDYGAMIDADKVRDNKLGVTPQILNELVDELISIPPTIIVTGDINY